MADTTDLNVPNPETTEIYELKKRVQTLENKFWVAVAVAAIFGISGAWGFSALSSAKSTIDNLVSQANSVKDTRDDAISRIKDMKSETIVRINEEADRRIKDIPNIAASAVNAAVPQVMDQSIAPLRKWTFFIYEMSHQTGGNGWFWDALNKSWVNAKIELKQ